MSELCFGKRRREDEGATAADLAKNIRIDKAGIQEQTLKRLMAAGCAKRPQASSSTSGASLILCEGCHKRAPPADSSCSSDSWALVGECRFCSRRSLCIDCWARCASCGMETCSLCSVKDYSGRDTVAVCLDCKRHQSRQKPLIRR